MRLRSRRRWPWSSRRRSSSACRRSIGRCRRRAPTRWTADSTRRKARTAASESATTARRSDARRRTRSRATWPAAGARCFSVRDDANEGDCARKPYAAYVHVAVSQFTLIEGDDVDVGLRLEDCGGWIVQEWHDHRVVARSGDRCSRPRAGARGRRAPARLVGCRPRAQRLPVLSRGGLGAGRSADVLLRALQDGRRQHAGLRARRAARRTRRACARATSSTKSTGSSGGNTVRFKRNSARTTASRTPLKSSAEARHSTFNSARPSCRQPEEHHERDRSGAGALLRRASSRVSRRTRTLGCHSIGLRRSGARRRRPTLLRTRRANGCATIGLDAEVLETGGQSARVRSVARSAGKTHGADLRPLRRAAGRSGRAVAHRRRSRRPCETATSTVAVRSTTRAKC